MKMYRVMGNKLGYGTFVAKDRIPTEKEAMKAAGIMGKCKRTDGEVRYFIQEYEESRGA